MNIPNLQDVEKRTSGSWSETADQDGLVQVFACSTREEMTSLFMELLNLHNNYVCVDVDIIPGSTDIQVRTTSKHTQSNVFSWLDLLCQVDETYTRLHKRYSSLPPHHDTTN